MQHALNRFCVCLLALGVIPAVHGQPRSQGAGLLAPLEPSTAAPYRAPTAAEAALLQQLIECAQREAVADTELFPLARKAIASGNPHLRANAFAMVQAAMDTLRAASGPRSQARRAALRAEGLPLALAGVRDPDGVVRRAALSAVIGFARDSTQPDTVTTLCESLLERDPEPQVRVVSLQCLLASAPDPVARALIERAVADPSPSVKGAGFSALWLRQAPDFRRFVVAKLHDETDRLTRITAAAALLNLLPVDPSVIDLVAARLAVEKDAMVRERLAGTLAGMQETAARSRKPGPP